MPVKVVVFYAPHQQDPKHGRNEQHLSIATQRSRPALRSSCQKELKRFRVDDSVLENQDNVEENQACDPDRVWTDLEQQEREQNRPKGHENQCLLPIEFFAFDSPKEEDPEQNEDRQHLLMGTEIKLT